MAIRYYRLMDVLTRQGLNREKLRVLAGIAPATMAKIAAGESVNMDIIDKICKALQCQPGDIMEYFDEDGNAPNLRSNQQTKTQSEDELNAYDQEGNEVQFYSDSDIKSGKYQLSNNPPVDSKKKRGRPSKKIEETQENQEVETLTEPPKPPAKQPEKIAETMASKLFFEIPIDMWESDKVNKPWKFEANEKYPLIDPQTGYAYRILPLGQNQIRQE